MTTVPTRSDVVWAPDPFGAPSANPRPWLVVAAARLPYADEEAIAVAFTTQSHHSGSLRVPSNAWLRGEPNRQNYVLPWTVATLKIKTHIVGTQGVVTDEFTDRVASALLNYTEPPSGSSP